MSEYRERLKITLTIMFSVVSILNAAILLLSACFFDKMYFNKNGLQCPEIEEFEEDENEIIHKTSD